jgi:hypothetical protein
MRSNRCSVDRLSDRMREMPWERLTSYADRTPHESFSQTVPIVLVRRKDSEEAVFVLCLNLPKVYIMIQEKTA